MVVPSSTLSTNAGIPEWVIYTVRRTRANQARRYIAPVAK
jgi:ribosomal protein L39E